MSRLLIFGPGYTAARIAAAVEARGWLIRTVTRATITDPALVGEAIDWASHILSSIPPEGDDDPVLARHGQALGGRRLFYLSSTGVYGDSGGAWIDESSATELGRRPARTLADRHWLALSAEAKVFRLPGIYGPGRSPLDKILDGSAHRIDVPGQVFSRIHVDDIVSGVVRGFDHGPGGAYNLADDCPAAQSDVIAHAAIVLGVPPPPLQSIEEADLSPMARSFYAANRRVANGKAKRLLGWAPRYPDYRAGLRALSATTSPTMASAPPSAASHDQR